MSLLFLLILCILYFLGFLNKHFMHRKPNCRQKSRVLPRIRVVELTNAMDIPQTRARVIKIANIAVTPAIQSAIGSTSAQHIRGSGNKL